MIKQVIVTFNFDPETEMVSDIKCSVDGVEKKKSTTKKVKNIIEELANTPLITLEENKLVFNNKAVSDMSLSAGERVLIEWHRRDDMMLPSIRKDEELGNKVTKSNTVTYRGNANKILANLGTEFTIVDAGDGTWYLNPTTPINNIDTPDNINITLEDAIIEAENTEAELLTELDENYEIDELPYII